MDEAPVVKPRRRKRELPWWVTVSVLLAVLAGFGGLIYYAYLPKNGIHVEQVDADARQKLTIGTSTREDAKAWFASQGISDVSESFDPGGRPNGYLAKIPNDNWMKHTQIEVRTVFDGNGKLKDLGVYQLARD